MALLVRGFLRASQTLPGLQSIRAATPLATKIVSRRDASSCALFRSIPHQPALRHQQQPAPKRCYTTNLAHQPITRNVATAATVLAEVPEGETIPVLNVGLHTTAGVKSRNDDRVVSIRLNDYAHLVAVFDGHGGSSVAEYLSHNVGPIVLDQMLDTPNEPTETLARAVGVLESTLAADRDMYARIGSTAVIALVTSDQIAVANVGDSRAFLVQGETAIQMTSDHRPSREDERLRIRAAGGSISWKSTPRVNGVLALTRSIGFFDLRNAGIIAEPEIFQHDLNATRDTSLVLMCDGVAEKVHAPTIANIASSNDPQSAAESLVQHALEQNGGDNMSAIVLSLNF